MTMKSRPSTPRTEKQPRKARKKKEKRVVTIEATQEARRGRRIAAMKFRPKIPVTKFLKRGRNPTRAARKPRKGRNSRNHSLIQRIYQVEVTMETEMVEVTMEAEMVEVTMEAMIKTLIRRVAKAAGQLVQEVNHPQKEIQRKEILFLQKDRGGQGEGASKGYKHFSVANNSVV
jgi:hypothetical protein